MIKTMSVDDDLMAMVKESALERNISESALVSEAIFEFFNKANRSDIVELFFSRYLERKTKKPTGGRRSFNPVRPKPEEQPRAQKIVREDAMIDPKLNEEF